MNIERAIACAREDYELIEAAARYCEQALIGAAVERAVIVDGSQYSPSWRAMRGGNEVHELGDDLGDAAQAYSEELDRLTDAYTGPSALYWEDGCLFLGAVSDDLTERCSRCGRQATEHDPIDLQCPERDS